METLGFDTPGRGLHEITDAVRAAVARSGLREGVCHLFILHTSASLVVTENADPSARRDIESYFLRLAPENDPDYTHTAEGPDDMPSHLRSVLTRNSETFIVTKGELLLGTWQGIFLFEHRSKPHRRKLAVRVMGV